MTFLSPYSTDKNIGKAYNDAVGAAPDGWICITDHDTMFLLPEAKKRIIEVCESTPEGDFVYSCMTNRLNPALCSHQLHDGRMSDDMNILTHYNIAKELAEDKILKKCNLIAGCCMIFRKSTWQKVKFRENTNLFDQLFSKDILKIKGTMAVIGDVYLFHLYRAWSDNPVNDIKHLN